MNLTTYFNLAFVASCTLGMQLSASESHWDYMYEKDTNNQVNFSECINKTIPQGKEYCAFNISKKLSSTDIGPYDWTEYDEMSDFNTKFFKPVHIDKLRLVSNDITYKDGVIDFTLLELTVAQGKERVIFNCYMPNEDRVNYPKALGVEETSLISGRKATPMHIFLKAIGDYTKPSIIASFWLVKNATCLPPLDTLTEDQRKEFKENKHNQEYLELFYKKCAVLVASSLGKRMVNSCHHAFLLDYIKEHVLTNEEHIFYRGCSFLENHSFWESQGGNSDYNRIDL